MIKEKINSLYQNYIFKNSGKPTILLISPENMAELLEEENVNPLKGISEFFGMELIVDESSELELHSYASFQAREYN